MSGNAKHYLFKIFRENMRPDPLEGLKIFSRSISIDPPKQKILDRILKMLSKCSLHLLVDNCWCSMDVFMEDKVSKTKFTHSF